jgi:hypothetical protein
MRKLIVCLILLAASTASAFTLALPEPLSPPTATQLSIDRIVISETRRSLIVEYRFLAADGTVIYLPSGRGVARSWTCEDRTEGPASTCFSDVFEFQIRAQDVGKKIGTGLWQLIWARMKADILKVAGNDIAP